MSKTHKQRAYVKDNTFTENIPLPILHDGERLWLDDVLNLLNGMKDNPCVLEIFVDGSCNHKKRIGAWAMTSNKFQRSGVIESDNSGHIELYATYKALLEAQKYNGDVIIYTDSQYVYSNVNWKGKEYGSLGWKSKSWRKRIPNKKLLQKIIPLMKPNIKVKKINRKNNKCADKLARKTMKEYDEGYMMGALPSQKYEHVLLAFVGWYNKEQISLENEITEKMVRDFLRKCDDMEIDVR